MKAGAPRPIRPVKGLVDIPYVCDSCGTQTIRTVSDKLAV
jgi:hypothetical protein